MSHRSLLPEAVERYVETLSTTGRETDIERRLRVETSRMAHGGMQIGPDQAAFLALLVAQGAIQSNMRTIATFKSDAFNTSEGRDYFINDCCFGDDGSWLYICSDAFVVRVKTKVKGHGF
jgi:hypothetical protein